MSGVNQAAETVELVVDEAAAGDRLDRFLSQQIEDRSRAALRRLIDQGAVTVGGRREKPRYAVAAGDVVLVQLPPPPTTQIQGEAVPLDLIYEDDAIVVVDKPADMVVHPARGSARGTLAAALVHHFDTLSQAHSERPGIVHRLDRDTTGVIVVAKTEQAHWQLARQFQERTVEKEYFAIVAGVPDRDRDRIDRPIGVHPAQREKMAVRRADSRSRPAESFYEVRQRFAGFASLAVFPKTGRTHQIRVHLASVGLPVLCDRQYGGRSQLTVGEISGAGDPTVLLARQALHARRLVLTHPANGERMEFSAPLPADIERTLSALAAHRPL